MTENGLHVFKALFRRGTECESIIAVEAIFRQATISLCGVFPSREWLEDGSQWPVNEVIKRYKNLKHLTWLYGYSWTTKLRSAGSRQALVGDSVAVRGLLAVEIFSFLYFCPRYFTAHLSLFLVLLPILRSNQNLSTLVQS